MSKIIKLKQESILKILEIKCNYNKRTIKNGNTSLGIPTNFI